MTHLKRIRNGVTAGLASGAALGIPIGTMGMLSAIGQLIGLPGTLPGSVAYLVFGAFMGGLFALLLGPSIQNTTAGLIYGAAYGVVWWLLCALTVIPLVMKVRTGTGWNLDSGVQIMAILLGYLIHGLILGGAFAWLEHRDLSKRLISRPAPQQA